MVDKSRIVKSVNRPRLGLIGPEILFIGNEIDVIVRNDDNCDNDGVFVGMDVDMNGDGVAAADGSIDGVLTNGDGILDGAVDGICTIIGYSDGTTEGTIVGAAVGAEDGAADGMNVGGSDIGSDVGVAVRDGIGAVVGCDGACSCRFRRFSSSVSELSTSSVLLLVAVLSLSSQIIPYHSHS